MMKKRKRGREKGKQGVKAWQDEIVDEIAAWASALNLKKNEDNLKILNKS